MRGILRNLGLVEPGDEFVVKDVLANVIWSRCSIAECTWILTLNLLLTELGVSAAKCETERRMWDRAVW